MKCDCCGDPVTFTDAAKKAKYGVPGMVLEYYYCSERCKQDHKMTLLRGSGL